MVIEVQVKKWGNSLGVILPKEIIEQKHLKEDDRIVLLDVVKEGNLSKSFGALKGKLHLSGQELKDMARKGWN